MNNLILGDIHGHIEVLKSALRYAEDNDLTLIQLGDLTDSFSRSIPDQVECLELAAEASHDHIFIMGNHDLSYLFTSLYRCSGYTPKKKIIFDETYRKIEFHKYLVIKSGRKDILITHAGLSKKFIESNPIEKITNFLHVFNINDYLDQKLEDPNGNIYKAGYDSGGSIPTGGIFWCRPRNFVPLEGITQVFGHTPSKKLIYDEDRDYYNLDCIEYGTKEALLFVDGEFKSIPYEEYA